MLKNISPDCEAGMVGDDQGIQSQVVSMMIGLVPCDFLYGESKEVAADGFGVSTQKSQAAKSFTNDA